MTYRDGKYWFRMAAQEIDLETVRDEITNNMVDCFSDLAKTYDDVRGVLDQSVTGFNDMSVEEHAGVYMAMNCIELGDLILMMPVIKQIVHGGHWNLERMRRLLDHEEQIANYIDSLE